MSLLSVQDERFTTRDAFLNLAKVTDYDVRTPPTDVISFRKVPANLTAIDEWVDANVQDAHAFIVSLELFVYGGLIQSRISNSTQAEVDARLQRLIDLHRRVPDLKM